MEKFTVIAYRKYTAWDKVYLEVEADNEEEAMLMAKDQPDEYEVDYKGLDVEDGEWMDLEEWEVIK